jgi:prepilin-type N-terminal cleavage/methylation domain-containing protein
MSMSYHRAVMCRNSGFSLVELSVVLLIIALLVAGVMTGKEVIRNAELKSVLAQVNDTKAAVTQFKLLYNRLPGDMENASTYWPGVVDGDNDGKIASEPSDEAFAALSHLSKARFINKAYSGLWDTGFVIGENVVPLDATGAALYLHCCSDTDYNRSIVWGNHITVFSVYNETNLRFRAGVVSPVEALGIDGKVDDGNPDAGFIWGSGSYNGTNYVPTGCYMGAGATAKYESNTARYKNALGCQMHFDYDKN